MAILPLQVSRVSSLMQGSLTSQAVDQVQQQLLQLQNEISTGKTINQPSDNPGSAAVVLQLQQTLDTRTAYTNNINQATSQLGETDSVLGNLNNLLIQAQNIASADVSSDVTDSQRQSDATVVNSLYQEALSLANTQYNGQYLFGADQQSTAPFVAGTTGVEYVGGTQVLSNTIDAGTSLNLQVSGDQVFGGLSSRIQGSANLTPAVSAATLLSSLNGATGNGVSLGTITIGNGTTTAQVSLANADSLGDVATDINAAGLAGVTAAVTPTGLVLTAGGGANITVSESGGTTALDLGILTPASGAGVNTTVTGQNLQPTITNFTPLSDLNNGAGIDTTGFTITNGQSSANISITANMTVEQLLNEINGANIGAPAQINAAGTGLDVQNATQGSSMSITEQGNGTTAADLGLLSYTASSPLSELNDGQGVRSIPGTNFTITRSDGTSFPVSLDNTNTVGDVVAAINEASGGTATTGVGVTAAFSNSNGNGIVLTDTAGGAGTLTVTPAAGSDAAEDLGLTAPAVGNVITGKDVNPVNTDGIFAHLQNLANALTTGDQNAITLAAQGLTTDATNASTIQGQVGAHEQELGNYSNQISSENTATQTLMSSLQDTDFASAVSQYQTLQTALQATLQLAGQQQNLSLFDYLTT